MGLFSGKSKPTPQDTAAEMRAVGKVDAAASAIARKVGLNSAADKCRRSAATGRVVARYAETGRCQFGHRNCTADDH